MTMKTEVLVTHYLSPSSNASARSVNTGDEDKETADNRTSVWLLETGEPTEQEDLAPSNLRKIIRLR